MSGNAPAEIEYWKRRISELKAELMVRSAEMDNLIKMTETQSVQIAFLKAANACKDAKIAQLNNYIAKAVPPSVGGTPLDEVPDYFY